MKMNDSECTSYIINQLPILTSNMSSWELTVYFKITSIVQKYYQYARVERTPCQVLRLFYQHWNGSDTFRLFDSFDQYYLVLSNVCDQLLTFLLDHNEYQAEHYRIFLEELYISLNGLPSS